MELSYNELMCDPYDISMYYPVGEAEIATEGLRDNITKVKQWAAKIADAIRRALQAIANAITSKFAKLLNMDRFAVSQKYFNTSMDLSERIMKVGSNNQQIILSVATFINNNAAIAKVIDDINKELDTLAQYETAVLSLKPDPKDRKLTFSTSYLNSYIARLYDIRDSGNKKLKMIERLCSDPTAIGDALKYTQTQINLINMTARVDIRKAELCIAIMENVYRNSQVVTNESVTTIWDDLLPANENYAEAKGIFKANQKNIEEHIRDIGSMPEQTKEQVERKLEAYKKLGSVAENVLNQVKAVRPSMADNLMSTINKILNVAVGGAIASRIKDINKKFSPTGPYMYDNAKTLVILLGMKGIVSAISGHDGERAVKNIKKILNAYLDTIDRETKKLEAKLGSFA